MNGDAVAHGRMSMAVSFVIRQSTVLSGPRGVHGQAVFPSAGDMKCRIAVPVCTLNACTDSLVAEVADLCNV